MRQSEPRRSGKPAADEAAAASSPKSAEERIRELEAKLAEARRAQDLAEARYAAMTANAPVGVAVLGLDGRFSDVNPTLCALTGHAPEEIVGHFPTEFSPPDQFDRSRAQFQKLIGGSGLELAEVELRHKDGHAVWVNAQLSLVRDSEGRPQHAILMAQDITGRKLGELALGTANARLARVVETQNEIAATAPQDLDAVIRLVAGRAEAMTGARGAIVELLDGDMLVARAATGTSASMLASVRPLAGSTLETAFSQRRALVHPESATICAPFFRGESAVGGLTVEGDAATFTEEHRQTLELLAVVLSSAVSRAEHVAALERFERIYRGSPIGIGMLGLDRQWLEVNDALCEVVGRSPDELRKLTPAAYVHPEDKRETAAAWATLAAGARDAYQIEARYIRPDGEVIWVSSSLSLVRDATGAPQFALVVAHDITQKKLAELRLQQQTRRVTAIAETQAEIANAGIDLDAAMALVAQRVRELTSAQAAAVVLAEGHEVLIGASCGEGAPSPGARRPVAGTLTAEVLAANKAQLVDDPADPRLYRTVFDVPDIESAVAVPLRCGDRIAGTIVAVSTNSDRPLTDDDVQTLDLLAVGLSAALSRTAELEAERRRVEALARFEAIFTHSPMAIGLLGLNGAWIDRNPASVVVTGRSIEEQRGVLVSEYTHPDDVTNSARQFGRMLRGEHDSYELEHRTFHKDGHVIWTKSRTALVRDANSEPEFAVVISEDTTERKRFEQALEEQSARFSRIAETQAELAAIGPDVDAAMQLVADRTRELVGSDVAAVLLVDGDELVTNARSGELPSDTPGRFPLDGSVAGEVVRTGRPLLVDDATDDRLFGAVADHSGVRSLAAVPLFQGERAAGVILASSITEERDLHEDTVRTLGLLAAVLSSTLSRAAELEAEQRRVEALSQFEAAWGTSPIGIEIISLDGRIVGANPAMDDVYGYSLEEYENLYVSDFTHPEDVGEVARRFYKLISGEYESDTCQIEARFFHKTRGLVWVDGAMALVRDAEGTPQYVLGMAQNVTERKQAELALAESNERLSAIAETQAEVASLGLDRDAAMQLVTERSCELIGADVVSVLLIEGDQLVSRARSGPAAPAEDVRVPLGQSVISAAIETRRPVLVTDMDDPRVYKPLIDRLGVTSFAAVPLHQGTKAIGAILAGSTREDEPIDEEDVRTLDLLSIVLSAALSSSAEVDAERRHVEALAQFETIFNKAPIPIGILNRAGKVVQANDPWRELTGYDSEALARTPMRDYVHEDDRDEAADQFLDLVAGDLEGDSYSLEGRIVQADGGVVWTDASLSLVRDGAGEPLFAIDMVQDITQRKLAEFALQDHSQRLARLIETQTDAIAAGFDVDTVSKLVAERAIEVIGAEGAAVNLLDGDELVVRAAVGLSAPWLGFRRPASEAMFSKESLRDGRATLVEHFAPLMKEWPALDELGDGSSVTASVYQGDKIVGTINVLNSEQGRRLGEDDRQVIGLVALVLTSALTRAAEYEALSRLEAIYNSAPIGIGLLNMNGAIVDANPAMLAITGASSLGGNPVTEIAHPDDIAEMSANFGRLARGEIESYRHEARYFKTDGGVAWVDSTVSVIRDADGKPKFALTMAQDVSERRAAEDQLRQAQKMEAVGQLSAGIAHDFNNLLMGVLGYAGLARGDVPDDSRVAEYLDRIEQSGQRAASLTKQLLAFGRRQTLQARDLDLNELVAETLSMLERLLGEQIEIVSRPEPSLPPLRADPTQLQQVLLNLALNARDAMPNGGTLTITTAAVEIDADDLDEPSELVPGRYVRLTVADTGLGMAAEVRGRIFEPFFTTKGVGEGTGLGLPSVYGIVKQSRGDIEVDSEPGLGTTFRIYLPSAAPPVEADAADAPTPRVLLVDDAPIVRDLVTTLLGDNGYDVVPASGAAEALAFAQEGHYDVLITDLVLSRADGADLAARVQEYQPTIRVLYMTAYVPDRRIDPESLISKPFANDELLSKLGAMLASEAEV
jgi:PAS domain S-box-containing protein